MINLEVYLEKYPLTGEGKPVGFPEIAIALETTCGAGDYIAKNDLGRLYIKQPKTAADLDMRVKFPGTDKVIRQVVLDCTNASEKIRGSREKAERRIDLNAWGIGRMQVSPDTWLVVRDQNAPSIPTHQIATKMSCEIWRVNPMLGNRGRRIVRTIA